MCDAVATESSEAAQTNTYGDALNLMIQGKRHLIVEDFSSATQCLEDACRLLDEKYGTMADECAEAYLFYGIALLDLSRQEMGAFDGVVKTKAVDEEEESDDEDEEADGEDEGEGEEAAKNDDLKNGEEKAEVESKEPKTPEEEATDSPKEQTPNEDKAMETETTQGSSDEPKVTTLDSLDQPGTSSGTTNENRKEDEEDEASTIETSWQVLKMASDIFRRQLEKGDEMKLKLAESLGKMGEIAIEWENNEHAIELFSEALAIRKDLLKDDDRLIAETYYHIGISYSFMAKMEEANTCFRLAIAVIEKRILKFEKILETTEHTDEKLKAERELNSLRELLPDMMAKIEDSKDQMSSSTEVSKALNEDEKAEKASPVKDAKVPTMNITHLVKRKRTEADNEQPTKKTCTTEVKDDTTSS